MNGAREEVHSVGAALCSVDMSFLLYIISISFKSLGLGRFYIYVYICFERSLFCSPRLHLFDKKY